MFLFFLLDDALLLHQNIGDYLANKFDSFLPLNLGLQPRHFELTVLAVVGMLLLVVVAWAYFHGTHEFRRISNDLLLFIVALVLFGLVVDLATAIKLGSAIVWGLVIVEDAGELVVDSLILWYVFRLAIHHGNTNVYLFDFLLRPKIP
jgi:hypothetical protein